MPDWLLSWGGNIIAAIIGVIAMIVGWSVKRKLEKAEKRLVELEEKITFLSAGRDVIITSETGQVVSGDGSFAVGGNVGGLSAGRDAIITGDKGQVVSGDGSFAVGGNVSGGIKSR